MKPAFVIIGLGNPGREYEKTRHNAGFMALDHLRAELGGNEWIPREKFLSTVSEVVADHGVIALVKPTTFMNRSGECVRKIVTHYKLDPAKQILVIVDDIDIPLGTHRLRKSGGPGTHNGMKSIVDAIGENFHRLRIGIGPAPENRDLATWVLSKLTKKEEIALADVFTSVTAVVRSFVGR